MKSYGIPYLGSKSKIADDICSIFPSADNFYDLFGGGFSITHYMLTRRSRDFKAFHFNEIRPGITELIKDSIEGKYSYKNYLPKFISKDEFFERKESDPMVKIVWSFGNNGEDYLFSKEIEHYKKSMHNAIVFNEFDDIARSLFGMDKFKDGYSIEDKRLFLRNKICFYKINGIPDFLRKYLSDKQLQQLEQLEQLEQLQQLEQLEQLQQLHFHNDDYRKVKIEKNSIVYCDIPYLGTTKYDNNKNFNHNEFFEWARELRHPLFVSEYMIKQDFMRLIFQKNIRSSLHSGSSCKRVERMYCNDLAFDLMRKK